MPEPAVRFWIDAIALAVTAAVLFGTVYDLILDRKDNSLGLQLAVWSHRYPLFAGLLIALLGGMLGHFLTQGWITGH